MKRTSALLVAVLFAVLAVLPASTAHAGQSWGGSRVDIEKVKPCSVKVKFSNFRPGPHTATISFSAVSITNSSSVVSPASPQTVTFTGSQGNNLNHQVTYPIVMSGTPSLINNKYNVLVSVNVNNTIGIETAMLEFPASCKQQTQVTPTPVTFTDPTCEEDGTYTIPSKTGVIYTINGQAVAAGTYPADNDSTVTVVATAASGFVLTGITSWTHEFEAPTDCEVEPPAPAAPTFTAPTCTTKGTYTIPQKDGYVYYVNDSNVPAEPGTYTAENGTTVTIRAYQIMPGTERAAAAQQIANGDEPVAVWSHTFTAPTDCVLGSETTIPSVPQTTVPQTSSTATTIPSSLPSTGTREVVYLSLIHI